MINNAESCFHEPGAFDSPPSPPGLSGVPRNIRPTLSLLNPDDIPPIRKLRVRESSKKPDASQLQLQLQLPEQPDIPYISPATSSSSIPLSLSDTDPDVGAGSSSCDTTCAPESQYSSAQLHYYRNRDKILAYSKLRYKNNREALLAYSKKYQSERKDIVKERNVTYYEANRVRLLKDRSMKITCECGKVIAKGSLSNHLNTAYHLRRIAAVSNREDIPPPPGLHNA